MRKRTTRVSPKSVRKSFAEFDSTEFLLLAFVAVVLLLFAGWQANLLPKFLTDSLILGASTVR